MSSSFPASAKQKSPRIYISTDKEGIVEALNNLLIKTGNPPRDPEKMQLALQNSLLCFRAKLFQDKSTIGFIRATGDGIFHASIWDLVVDPDFPNQNQIRRLLLERVQRDMKRIYPQCVVSRFAPPEELELLSEINFIEDYKGIRPMALRDENQELE
ncbi:MAG: N-acetyltransferase [Cyanobacteria bacterium P01_F01_bin.143]